MMRTRPLVAFAALALMLPGCSELIGDTGPAIVSVTISPDTISQNSTGMTDQFFDVTIETSGFTSELESATVTIQDLDREGEPTQPATIDGSTIVINDIAQSWFQGVEPGEYPISAEVLSADGTESVFQLDVATVTVTE